MARVGRREDTTPEHDRAAILMKLNGMVSAPIRVMLANMEHMRQPVGVLALTYTLSYVLWLVPRSLGLLPGWIALPQTAAVIYLTGLLAVFCFMTWTIPTGQPVESHVPPQWTGDIFIVTRGDHPSLLAATLRASSLITFPHEVYVLDAFDSPVARALSQSYSARYVPVPPDEQDERAVERPISLTSALLGSSGELILLLNAGQMPEARVFETVTHLFADPRTAYVQLARRQCADQPEEAQLRAPISALVQAGRSAWGAALAEESAVIYRREALRHLGLCRAERSVRQSAVDILAGVHELLARARVSEQDSTIEAVRSTLDLTRSLLRSAHARLRGGASFEAAFRPTLDLCGELEDDYAGLDLAALQRDLALPEGADPAPLICPPSGVPAFRLALVALSPLGALAATRILVRRLEGAYRAMEQVLVPLTILSPASAAMASIELHGLGWRGRYDATGLVREIAARAIGLAPATPETAVDPLRTLLRNWRSLPGMTWGQRLVYASEIYAALSGIALAVLVLSPVVGLLTSWVPAGTQTEQIALRAIPALMSIATFISLTSLAAGMPQLIVWDSLRVALVAFPQSLTRLVRGASAEPVFSGTGWNRATMLELVRWQLVLVALCEIAVTIGGVRLSLGLARDPAAMLAQAALALLYALLFWSAVGPAIRRQPAREHTTHERKLAA